MYEEWRTRNFHPEFSLMEDIWPIIIFPICLIFIRKYLKNNLTNFIMQKSGLNKEKQKEIYLKFSGSLYRFVFYTFAFICEILILKNETWCTEPFQYTLEWPGNQTPRSIRVFYIFELWYYILGVFFLLTEEKLKDFNVMLTHHLVTASLIAGSFMYNLFRYGIVIMAIHDISDPFLEFSKLNVYLENIHITNILFVIFSILFFTMRMIIYPGLILAPITYYSYIYGSKILLFFSSFLYILFGLHIIWSFIIGKMAYKLLVKEELLTKDDREESNAKKNE